MKMIYSRLIARSTNFSAPCKLLKLQCHSGFASTNPENLWTGSSMVEQLTLNQRVGGSSPPRFTKPVLFNTSGSEQINPILRGWVNYFAVGDSSECFSFVTSCADAPARRAC